MTKTVSVRLAKINDAASIAAMLARLAHDLGDTEFQTTSEIVRESGFDARRLYHCQIASVDGKDVGVALYFRNFSTTKACPGVYVQDLWVDDAARGAGIGQELLAAVVKHAVNDWQAAYLKLTVHTHNPDAERFYTRLGFTANLEDRPMVLAGEDFTKLQSTAQG